MLTARDSIGAAEELLVANTIVVAGADGHGLTDGSRENDDGGGVLHDEVNASSW